MNFAKQVNEELFGQLLMALAAREGGEIVIMESELQEQRAVIDIDEAAGLVRIVVVPDFVSVPDDEPTGVSGPIAVPEYLDPIPSGQVYPPPVYTFTTDTSTNTSTVTGTYLANGQWHQITSDTTGSTYVDGVLSQNPVAYWPLSDSGSTTNSSRGG